MFKGKWHTLYDAMRFHVFLWMLHYSVLLLLLLTIQWSFISIFISTLALCSVEGHPDYDPEVSVVQHLHKALGSKINHMVCVPVLDVYGNTIAVIQATNKKKGTADDGFSQDDEQVLQVLATHISVSMQNIYSNTETSVKEVIQLLKISNTPA